MPRRSDAIITPNRELREHRRRLPSPHRAGQSLSRSEFADAVNRELHTLYPQSTALEVDARWVGKLERGETRWPCEERRAALRQVTGVTADGAIGLYSPRLRTEGPARVWEPRAVDIAAPHPARRYNYWLGGKDHFAADRESADAISRVFPGAVAAARANREFLRRGVRHLTGRGVRQFVDVGAGLPAAENVHDMAPDGRVLYVDNDPIVMAHARALLDDGPDGRTACLEADLRDPQRILTHPMIDPDRPVGLLLAAVLHYVHDDEQAHRAVREMVKLLPRGSFLVLSHVTLDFTGPATVAGLLRVLAGEMRPRPRHAIGGYLDGLEPVAPGLVPLCDWWPGPDRATAADVVSYGAVARLP